VSMGEQFPSFGRITENEGTMFLQNTELLTQWYSIT